MPTVLRKNGYRFFFFSIDDSEPIHIHVERAGSYAKFWLNPVSLARNHCFRSHELFEIGRLVKENKQIFEEKWNEHFSS